MNVRHALTVRYVLALTLVASALVITHLVERKNVDGAGNHARLINISGMQRMLSQRVALLARELALADDADSAEALASKLDAALGTMTDNHDELSDEWRARAARGEPLFVDLTSEEGLDTRVRRFIASSDLLLDLHRRDLHSSMRESDLPDRLAAVARGDFLTDLDAVVKHYERESVAKTDRLELLGTLSMSAGLCLLIVEALFIFRPMVRTIASTVDSLERANATLEEANEELAQFNYRVSHDIIAPIATARGYLELAIDELEDDRPDELPELLSDARAQLDRLDALVVDLSSLARAGADTSRTERIELRPLVSALSAETSRNGLSIETALALPEIDSDPTRIRQMLANLIDNAVKYHDPAERFRRITVSSRREGETSVIEVSDNGIGIDPGFGERAFEMFARDSSSVPGTGLGLYIIGKHANRLGGTLSIANNAKPTVMRITLPCSSGAAA